MISGKVRVFVDNGTPIASGIVQVQESRRPGGDYFNQTRARIRAMSNNESGAFVRLNETFGRWTQDYRELGDLFQQFNDWMTSQVSLDRRNIHEVPQRLRQIQSRLAEHFEMERSLSYLLASARGGSTLEVDATRRQAEKDHAVLCDRLQRLIESTTVDHVGSDEWNSYKYELNLFIDALEQHQELERDNLRSLIPSSAARFDSK